MVQRRAATAMRSVMLHSCTFVRSWLGLHGAFLLMLYAIPSCISLWRSFFPIPSCNSNFDLPTSHSLDPASSLRHLARQSAVAGVIQAFGPFLHCITICFDNLSLTTTSLGPILVYTQSYRQASYWRCIYHVFSDLPLERSRRHQIRTYSTCDQS